MQTPIAHRQVRSWLVLTLFAGLTTGCSVAPSALDPEETANAAQASLEKVRAQQAPVTRPIDLHEAMARAVLYNLDSRVELMEIALRSRQAESATLSMLPALVAGAGYAGRNKFDASSSTQIGSGTQNFTYSTSQDREIHTRDLSLSWNVLDFGLSYIRAKQASDRVLIAQEQRRKALARIVEEVRGAYWRALAAEYLSRDLKKLQARVRIALQRADELGRSGQAGPLVALTYQRDIYEITERIQQIETEVSAARSQLAALMNLSPQTRFSLVRPTRDLPAAGAFPNPALLVNAALENRPELRAVLYDQKIGELDGTAALLELLPGINLNTGPAFTSNSFTAYQDWWGWGAKASWNLMRLASYPVRRNELAANDVLLAERVSATAAAIALQVYVSRTRFDQTLARATTLSKYSAVQQKVLAQLKASANAEQSGEIELVREELTALLARARFDVAAAEAQSAYASMLTAVGIDPYPADITASLPDLARAFRSRASDQVKLVKVAETSAP